MASRDTRYVITHSNFTKKKTHKRIDGATIFERDFMTTTNLGGWDSGSIPWGEGNFKIVTDKGFQYRKKHNRNNWLKIEPCDNKFDEDACTMWTLNNLGNTTEQSTDTKITTKPNIHNLRDFVYYGSAEEFVKNSLKNVINKFPGELCITEQSYTYFNNGEYEILGTSLGLNKPVLVENPFNIDITTLEPKNSDDKFEILRCFANSLNKYEFINSDNTISCIKNWTVDIKPLSKICDGAYLGNIKFNDGDLVIYQFYVNKKFVLITDLEPLSGEKQIIKHTRLKKDVIDDIINNDLTLFERSLINTTSTPKYTIYIDSPIETESGVVVSKKAFTMPLSNGWNIDIDSFDYSSYISDLLSVANKYDELYSDNLWKNMVHESIKNMDIILPNISNTNNDSNENDYYEGVETIHTLFKILGDFYDGIKFSIDNIKTVNNISYNELNNTPDYFLSDTLQLSGWEVSNSTLGIDETKEVGYLYPGNTTLFNAADTNNLFMRELKINSRTIFNSKGTMHSLEQLLSLFGLCSYEFGKNYYEYLPESKKINKFGVAKKWNRLTDEEQSRFYDYRIKEFVAVAKNDVDDVVTGDTENIDAVYYNSFKINANSDDSTGILDGLPVKIVTLVKETEEGEFIEYKYLVPWFDKKLSYDGSPYFQMYGGWFKDEDGFYDETKTYLNVVSNVGELSKIPYHKLKENEIFYVFDLSDYNDYYHEYSNNISNYFKIVNPESLNEYGTESGWNNIPQTDIDSGVKDGLRVIQLNKIIDESKGNNPHVGYGIYDDGNAYLDIFKHLFNNAIKNELLKDDVKECDTCDYPEKLLNCGFDVSLQQDNVKTWYFTDTNKESQLYRIVKKYTLNEDDVEIFDGYELPENSGSTVIEVGKNAYANGDVSLSSELEAFNLETQTMPSIDECAANSIINVKKITIEFNPIKYGNQEFNNFLHKSILPYLKQIVPSTCVVEIINNKPIEMTTCLSTPTIVGF